MGKYWRISKSMKHCCLRYWSEATLARTQERGGERMRDRPRAQSLASSCRIQQGMVSKLNLILHVIGNHWRALGRGGTGWCILLTSLRWQHGQWWPQTTEETGEQSGGLCSGPREVVGACITRSNGAGESKWIQRDLLMEQPGRQGYERNSRMTCRFQLSHREDWGWGGRY